MLKVKYYILAVFLVLHLLYSLFCVIPGCLIIDDVTYSQMAKNFADSQSLEIWNGYQEFPSRELVGLGQLRAYNGRLVAQYPYFYPVLAWPFYRLAGFHGLFLLNSLAFLIILLMVYLLTRKLFADENLALNACLIFIFADFAWEYSQAIWPHALSTLFVVSATYCAVCASYAARARSSAGLAMIAGLLVGLGAGVHLSVFFGFPVMVIILLLACPWSRWAVTAFLLGTLPGLGLLSATNFRKFGTFSPFSYGNVGGPTRGIGPYLPLVSFGLLALVMVWLCLQPRFRKIFAKHLWLSLSLVILLGGIALYQPSARNFGHKLWHGAHKIVVDLRVPENAALEPIQTRSPGGAILYVDGLKKSLVQSSPYLVILLLPLAAMVRREKDSIPLLALFLVPATFTGVFSYFAWHGGPCVNMRYLVPILPFTAILSAYAWREMSLGTGSFWGWLAAAGAGLLALGLWHATSTPLSLEQQEAIYLKWPLVLAACLTLATLPLVFFRREKMALVRGLAVVLTVLALTWSGLVAFFHDYPWALRKRAYHYTVSQTMGAIIPPDSLLVAQYPDPFYGLIEAGKVRLAIPRSVVPGAGDDFADFGALIHFHLAHDRAVFAAFLPVVWEEITRRGLLHGYTIVGAWEVGQFRVVRIVSADAGGSAGGKIAPDGS
jgi:4-amino-4-deoxy-L-arabinose transferase-like glycosyltransferase